MWNYLLILEIINKEKNMEHQNENMLDIDNLISEVHLITQAPKHIIFSSFLSVLASVSQGLLDVEIKQGLKVPTSLFILTIAKSGERKSTVDNLLSKELLSINTKINSINRMAKTTYQSEFDRWDIERKLIQKKYKKQLAEQLNDAQTSQLQQELLLIHEKKPKAMLLTNIVYHDITIEALLANLTRNQPNTILSSSDAGNILNKLNYQYLSYINKLWDGDMIQIERKKEGEIIIDDARLSISMMIQPQTFDDILSRKKRIRETGTLARMLVIHGESTQGYRQYSEINEELYLNAFYQRINNIYKVCSSRNLYGIERLTAIITPAAKEIWIRFYNAVENELGNGELSDIDDFASKISNNVARIAALLHYYQHNDLDICEPCMRHAINFGSDAIDMFKSLFGEKTIEERAKEYAGILLDWLDRNSQQGGYLQFLKSHIYQYGPSILRNKENLEMALWRLYNDHYIDYYPNAKPAFIVLRGKLSGWH